MALRSAAGIRAGTEDRWVETTDGSGRAVIVPAIASKQRLLQPAS
jgi:hypothetical protein